ncbi:MAG: hypothetical protein RR623_08265, partial [Bacilli bacterium]
ELVILYLVVGDETHILEVEETELNNIRDYISNIIESGFNDFKLYDNYCGFGPFGEIAEIKDGEIIYLEQEVIK